MTYKAESILKCALSAVWLLLLAAGCAGPEPDGTAAAPPHYRDELAAVDDAVLARQRVAQAAASAPAQEALALARLERAQLTGRFDDYAAAAQAMDGARAAGGAAAVCAGDAHVQLALHRLAAAAAAIERCAAQTPELSTVSSARLAALRGRLALQQGRYADALAQLRTAASRSDAPEDVAQLALYYAITGAPAEAEALFERAATLDRARSPRLQAWLRVQMGLLALARGRWEDALALYLAAERQLSGWWRVAEHVAEVRALLGQHQAAVSAYRALVADTGHPEIMDALAALLRDRDGHGEAPQWIERARREHDRRCALLPEAGCGHTVAHYLRYGAPAEALRLAQADFRMRPGGDASVALVRALLRADRAAQAETMIERLLASGAATAELHWLAAQVFERRGRRRQAADQRTQALHINPRAAIAYAR